MFRPTTFGQMSIVIMTYYENKDSDNVDEYALFVIQSK